jgi:ribosomal protein S18 acetylase RimI-like enzyme
MGDPQFAHYIEGWPREGDFGVVAVERRPIGAAWWRFFDSREPGFGFVAAAIPELSIGVIAGARGRGVGKTMMRALVVEAEQRGLPGLSLSVEPDNHAIHLYAQLGFRRVGATGGAVTMLLDC